MSRFLLCLLLLTAPAGALAAPKSAEVQVLSACLANAEKSVEFGGACIGIVANPCIAIARKGNNSVPDAQKCATRELKIWTELMKTAIAESLKGADADMKSAIVESQKTWVQSREKFCPLFDNLDPGLTLGAAEYCRLQETAHRVLSLRRLAAAVTPH